MKLSLDEFDGNLPTLESLDGSPMETNPPVQGKVDEVKEPKFQSIKANAEQNIFGDTPSPYKLPEELRRKRQEDEEYDPYSSAHSGYDIYGSDNSDFSTLDEQARTLIKVTSIVTIFISVLYAVFFHYLASIAAAIVSITAAILFMKGKNIGRILLTICNIFIIISIILFTVMAESEGMQLLYVFLAAAFTFIEYLLCFDKRIKAYFGK